MDNMKYWNLLRNIADDVRDVASLSDKRISDVLYDLDKELK